MIGLLAESAVNTRGPDAAAGRARKIARGLALLSQQETTAVLVDANLQSLQSFFCRGGAWVRG